MMKNGFLVTVSVLSILGFSASSSLAVVTVDVYASSGPSFDESPSFDAFGDNAISAIENGNSSKGSGPARYESVTEMTAKDFVESPNFTSWRGDASPSGVYSNEHGNQFGFGVNIQGDGNTQFRLHDLQYEIDSNDSNDWFDVSGDFSSAGYSDYVNGIDWGDDNAPGGGDDVRYESGNGDELIDQIVGILNVNSLIPDENTTGTNQDQLNELIEDVNGESPFDITAEYILTMNGIPGTSIAGGNTTISVSSTPTVPSPSSGTLALAAMGGLLAKKPRRQR